jgi:hypothetical protein
MEKPKDVERLEGIFFCLNCLEIGLIRREELSYQGIVVSIAVRKYLIECGHIITHTLTPEYFKTFAQYEDSQIVADRIFELVKIS